MWRTTAANYMGRPARVPPPAYAPGTLADAIVDVAARPGGEDRLVAGRPAAVAVLPGRPRLLGVEPAQLGGGHVHGLVELPAGVPCSVILGELGPDATLRIRIAG